MRLIDSDKLTADILALRDCPNGYSGTYDKACIIGMIEEQPTVEAIPIKWLTAQADNPSNSDKLRNAIDYIVYTLWAERKEE